MNYVYYWVSEFKGFRSLADGVFVKFFEKGGFLWGLAIAFGVGLLIATFFYFFICNKYHSLAKRAVWWGILVVVGGVTYLATENYAQKGLALDIKKYADKQIAECGELGSSEAETECAQKANEYRNTWLKEVRRPHDCIVNFGLMSGFYSIFFFSIFSFLFKRHTIYGKAVPCGGAMKNRK